VVSRGRKEMAGVVIEVMMEMGVLLLLLLLLLLWRGGR